SPSTTTSAAPDTLPTTFVPGATSVALFGWFDVVTGAEGAGGAAGFCGVCCSRPNNAMACSRNEEWSGQRDSKPPHQSWEARTLPRELCPREPTALYRGGNVPQRRRIGQERWRMPACAAALSSCGFHTHRGTCAREGARYTDRAMSGKGTTEAASSL